MFEKVVGRPGSNGASDKTYNQSELDISGSNETMQNALASIVFFFEIFFMFHKSQKFELLCFLSDLGEICYGDNIGERSTCL